MMMGEREIIRQGHLTNEILRDLLVGPRMWIHSTCTIVKQNGVSGISIHIHRPARWRFWRPSLTLGVVNDATNAAYVINFEQFKAIMELPVSVPEELQPYKPTWLDIMAIIRPIGETNG